MKQLAVFARFIHFTNLLISTATVALCFQTSILLDWLFIPNWFYVFMFTGTFLLYGLHHLSISGGTTTGKPKPAYWLKNRQILIGYVAASAIITGYLFFNLHTRQLKWLAVLVAITLFYSIPVLPFKKLRKPRQNGVLKLLVLAAVGTITTTVIPTTFIPYGFDSKFWWLATVRFFYMVAIYIPFEIRDEITDGKSYNATLVSIFGEEGCYKLSYAALGIAAFGVVPGLLIGVNILFLIMLLLSLIITGWMINYSSRQVFSPNSYMILEISMILQTLLICIPLLIP